MNYLKGLVRNSKLATELHKCLEKKGSTVHLEQLVGGAFSLYAADAVERIEGIHIFLMEDRDSAAYLVNDFYELLGDEHVAFFPSGYKRSVAYGSEDAQGVVQRTSTLNAITNFREGYLVVCTYPEALAETVTARVNLDEQSLHLRTGDTLAQIALVSWLDEHEFTRVEFVYEPGQYSVRGGLVDIFFGLFLFAFRFRPESIGILQSQPTLWLYAFAIALFPTAVSLLCTSAAISHIGSTPVAILGALEPVTAVAFAVTVFHEPMTVRLAVGMVLVILAVTVIIAGGSINHQLLRFRRMFPSLRKHQPRP